MPKVIRELQQLAGRAQILQGNAEIITRTQARVQGGAEPDTILAVLHEGRGD